ncbi:hypothetical protein T439DRAFT_377004 [Meredithblackwellia eburnea MCA 4105]
MTRAAIPRSIMVLGACVFSLGFLASVSRLVPRVETSRQDEIVTAGRWVDENHHSTSEETTSTEDLDLLNVVGAEIFDYDEDSNLEVQSESAESPRDEDESSSFDYMVKSFGKRLECGVDALELARKPAYWEALETSPLRFSIAPRRQSPVLKSPCLDEALFSARLVSSSVGDKVISPLPYVQLSKNSASFRINVDRGLQIPAGTYELQIRLEFASLPGGIKGQVCGSDTLTCGRKDIPSKVLPYVGQKVEVSGGGQIGLGLLPQAMAPPKLCTKLSHLSGYWKGKRFFPVISEVDEEGPCRLVTPVFKTNENGEGDSRKDPVWIHLVGDSNIRNLNDALASSFGNGAGTTYWESASKVKNGTVAAIAFRYASGAPRPDLLVNPDIILTWQWWEASGEDFDAIANGLVQWVNGTLSEFVARAHLKQSLYAFGSEFQHIASNIRPSRTYVTLESHSSGLTRLGVEELLDTLFQSDPPFLSDTLVRRSNLKFFTTTEVNTGNIPLWKYPKQDAVRNNAVIQAKNEVIRRRRELSGRVVDAQGLTRGITEDFMKQGSKPDAVHFEDFVYIEWARLVWTDLVVNGIW